MSKIESSAGKAIYEQQETKLSQQSAAFIELLTKRGILGDSSIDDDRVRQAKKEKKKSRAGQADARGVSVPSGHLCPALLPAPHAGNQYHRPAPMVCPCRRGGFLAGGSFYLGKLVRLKVSIITLLLQERDK